MLPLNNVRSTSTPLYLPWVVSTKQKRYLNTTSTLISTADISEYLSPSVFPLNNVRSNFNTSSPSVDSIYKTEQKSQHYISEYLSPSVLPLNNVRSNFNTSSPSVDSIYKTEETCLNSQTCFKKTVTG